MVEQPWFKQPKILPNTTRQISRICDDRSFPPKPRYSLNELSFKMGRGYDVLEALSPIIKDDHGCFLFSDPYRVIILKFKFFP